MSQQELLGYVGGELDRAGIPYMLTGSFASSYYGEPRLSHDIDLVVELSPHEVPALARVFPKERFYFDEISISEAIERRDHFNLMDQETFDKIDFWVLKDDAWNRQRFARRQRKDLDGLDLWVISPEDLILSKLRWSQMSGGSAKQVGDVIGVYEVQRAWLDEDYLNTWAGSLDLERELSEVRHRALPPS